jgi:predicted hydrocarbon binding protein
MLPDKLVRSYLITLEDLLGKHGVNTILNLSGLPEWIDNYPSGDVQRAVSYEDFSRIQASLEDIYGERTGQNLSRRASHASFVDAGANLLALEEMDLSTRDHVEKIKLALNAFTDLFQTMASGDVKWTGTDSEIEIHFQTCPNCVNRDSNEAICQTCVGWIEGLFELIGAGEAIEIVESSCLASGGNSCSFLIRSD